MKKKPAEVCNRGRLILLRFFGAGEGIRTLDVNLGKRPTSRLSALLRVSGAVISIR